MDTCICMAESLCCSLEAAAAAKSLQLCPTLSATPWTVASQAPLSMGYFQQEYWSGLPFPLPGDLPSTGTEFWSPALQANPVRTEPPGKPSYLLEHFIPGARLSCSALLTTKPSYSKM